MPIVIGKKKDGAAPAAKKGKAKVSGGRLPSKRSINLANVNEKKINWLLAVPLVLLVLAGAFAFGKFAVADRFAVVSELRSEVKSLQQQIDADNAELESYGLLNELYAHYTYSGMTEEELRRVDRVTVMELLRSGMSGTVQIGSWAVHGNEITVSVQGPSLQSINDLSQRFLRDSRVDFCTVTTAKMQNGSELTEFVQEGETVSASIVIYLNDAGEEDK